MSLYDKYEIIFLNSFLRFKDFPDFKLKRICMGKKTRVTQYGPYRAVMAVYIRVIKLIDTRWKI